MQKIGTGGVEFVAKDELALKLLIHTRIASKVFKQILVKDFKDQNSYYDSLKNHPWEDHFELEQTFKISSIFDKEAKEQFNNSVYYSQKLKDVIVDRFREVNSGNRPDVDTKYPDISFVQRIEKSLETGNWKSIISIDLCGHPLSNRGYREPGHEAPLRENLAAAILILSNWDFNSEDLIDSMCGSGTVLI